MKVRDCFLFNKPLVFAYSALQGADQLLPLVRIACVTSLGSLESVLRVLLGETEQALFLL